MTDSKDPVDCWLETLPGRIYEYCSEQILDVVLLPRNIVGLGA
jgi:hypothetical protein